METAAPSTSAAFPHLFEPITIGGATIRNRIVSSGHDTVMAVDGLVTDRLVAYQEARPGAAPGSSSSRSRASTRRRATPRPS